MNNYRNNATNFKPNLKIGVTVELPKYHETFKPILEVLSAKGPLHYKKLGTHVRDKYYSSLPKNLLEETVPSTGDNKLLDRIYWGRSHLKLGKFVEYPKRGTVKITDKGMNVLTTGNLTLQDLRKDPDYVAHMTHRKSVRTEKSKSKYENIEDYPPPELIDFAFLKIKEKVTTELLEELRAVDPPHDLQKIVLILLKRMGYGDPVETKKSRDRGIDGIINEDKLGFEKIYIQTKRYKEENEVREGDIRNFIGAITPNNGVFVTTSRFDRHAKETADNYRPKMILIDGEKLADLMYEYDVGVKTSKSYEIKDIDSDFFDKVEEIEL